MKLIKPANADESLHRIYETIRDDLKINYVPDLFQALAAYPEYLSRVQEALEPVVTSLEFDEAAEKVTQAAEESVADLPLPPAEQLEHLLTVKIDPQIAGDLHAFAKGEPKALLIATIIHASIRGERGEGKHTFEPATPSPHGPALRLVEEELPSKAVEDIYQEIEGSTNLSFIPSEYRAMAKWPPFLTAAWDHIHEVIGSAPYDLAREKVVESAYFPAKSWFSPETLGLGALLDSEISDEDQRSVVSVIRDFKRMLADLVVQVQIMSTVADSIMAIQTEQTSEQEAIEQEHIEAA